MTVRHWPAAVPFLPASWSTIWVRRARGLNLYRAASNGLIQGIEMRAGTAADEGVDGVEFAQKDAFFTAHLEALWINAHLDN